MLSWFKTRTSKYIQSVMLDQIKDQNRVSFSEKFNLESTSDETFHQTPDEGLMSNPAVRIVCSTLVILYYEKVTVI